MDNIKKLLEDEENGIEMICNHDSISDDITINKLKRGIFITQYRDASIIDKIINILNDYTYKKNRKWCKTRIHTAFDSLIMLDKVYESYNDMIVDIINHIMNYDSKYLPEKYNELCHKITFKSNINGEYFPDNCDTDLSSLLNYMKCSKCNNLHNEENNENICYICSQDKKN